jgi:hypothetical protein
LAANYLSTLLDFHFLLYYHGSSETMEKLSCDIPEPVLMVELQAYIEVVIAD